MRMFILSLAGLIISGAAYASPGGVKPGVDDGFKSCLAFIENGEADTHDLALWKNSGFGALSQDYSFRSDKAASLNLTYGFGLFGKTTQPSDCFVEYDQDERWEDWLYLKEKILGEELGANAAAVATDMRSAIHARFGNAFDTERFIPDTGGREAWCSTLGTGRPVSVEVLWYTYNVDEGPIARLTVSRKKHELCD